MKKLISILFLSVILFSCESENKEVQVSKTPEEMGEVIFNAIKNENGATIRTYFAKNSDIDELLAKSNLSEKKKEKKKKKLQKKVQSLNDGIAKDLAKIHDQEIKWSETTFDWIDHKNFVKDSVTGADIYIVFSEDQVQYEIKLDDCYITSRGWVLFDRISFKGARK